MDYNEANKHISRMVVPESRERLRLTGDGVAYAVGILGFFVALIAAGADLANGPNAPAWSWALPIVVVAFLWQVFIPTRELHSRTRWPLLFRYPLEIALILSGVALVAILVAGWSDRRFWGILGGIASVLAGYVRGRIEADARGREFDRSLGALSAYVRGRRWGSNRTGLPL